MLHRMVPAIDNDPCRSRDGLLKERWPSWESAWYVAELVLLGQHGRADAGTKAYAYRCSSCKGWHLATCRSDKQLRLHRRQLAKLRVWMMKNPLRARKK